MNAAFLFVLALAALFLLWKVFALSDYFYRYWKASRADSKREAVLSDGERGASV